MKKSTTTKRQTKSRCRIPAFELEPEEKEEFMSICEENVTKSNDVLRALVRAFNTARRENGLVPYPLQLRSPEEVKRATSIGDVKGRNVAIAAGDGSTATANEK